MNNKKSTVIIAILAMALTSTPTLTARCVAPEAAMGIAPFHGLTPFTANIHYTLTGIPITYAIIYFGDGTSEILPNEPKVGIIHHTYTIPGAYTVLLFVTNDCAGFALLVTVYAT